MDPYARIAVFVFFYSPQNGIYNYFAITTFFPETTSSRAAESFLPRGDVRRPLRVTVTPRGRRIPYTAQMMRTSPLVIWLWWLQMLRGLLEHLLTSAECLCGSEAPGCPAEAALLLISCQCGEKWPERNNYCRSTAQSLMMCLLLWNSSTLHIQLFLGANY